MLNISTGGFSDTPNFKSGWLDEDPRVTGAALLGTFVFVLHNILLYKSEKRKKMLKQQAIDNNTVIEARLYRRHRDTDTESDLQYSGWYRYIVN